jgi:hypothetical protein
MRSDIYLSPSNKDHEYATTPRLGNWLGACVAINMPRLPGASDVGFGYDRTRDMETNARKKLHRSDMFIETGLP